MDLNNRRTGKHATKPRALGLFGHSDISDQVQTLTPRGDILKLRYTISGNKESISNISSDINASRLFYAPPEARQGQKSEEIPINIQRTLSPLIMFGLVPTALLVRVCTMFREISVQGSRRVKHGNETSHHRTYALCFMINDLECRRRMNFTIFESDEIQFVAP